jgi:hypothetical protein
MSFELSLFICQASPGINGASDFKTYRAAALQFHATLDFIAKGHLQANAR